MHVGIKLPLSCTIITEPIFFRLLSKVVHMDGITIFLVQMDLKAIEIQKVKIGELTVSINNSFLCAAHLF